MTRRLPLITDHWHRPGPVNADGTDGYWICNYRDCGQHRGDHLQAEGHWLKPLHAFVPLVNYRPRYCKACGREWRHTTHTPWTWEQLAPNPALQPAKEA